MTRRPSAFVLSLFLSLFAAACNRSENLGSLSVDSGLSGDGGLPGDGTGQAGNDGGLNDAGGCAGKACLQPLGTSCVTDGMCQSGFCVDKVCCNTACTGTCMTCDVAGSVGTCTQTPACGQDPAPLGILCTSAAGCQSGFCVDGVCCNTACTGTCMTCDAAGSAGTCSQAAACP